MRPASRLRSFGSPSHAFGSQLSHIADFLGAAALILFTTWQTATFLQNFEVSAYITLLIILLTALNVIGLLVAIAYQRTVFTITFFFTLVFFSLAPMQQLLNQFDPIMSEPAILSRAFEFCLIFSAFCMAALLVMGSAPRLKNQILRPPSESFPSSACTILIVLLCVAISIGFTAFGRGLFTDRTTYTSVLESEYSQPVILLYTGALRLFMIYGSVVGLWIAWMHRRVGWLVAFSMTLISSFVLTNPMITPRSEFAAAIFTVIFYFGGRHRNRLLGFILMMSIAAAPFFNLFRLESGELEQRDFSSFLASGDFDALSLLSHTIWHVDHYGLDYGKNIISAIFFFVPRALWPTKNEITPFYLMDSLRMYRGLWSYNLSDPIIGEGYFAFGITGVFALTLLYVWFAWFLELKAGENRLSVIYLFCCAAPPLLFTLLRGPLMIGITFIIGHLLTIALAVKIANYRFVVRRPLNNLRTPGLGAARLWPPR